MVMSSRADIVIIGGAVIGSAVAYFLSKEGFKGRVVVVEKDPTYQFCATGRSLASLRQQFSVEENIRLSQFGVQFVQNVKSEFGSEADVSFKPFGYLMMASADGRAVLERNVALQRALGADTELLEAKDINRRFPWLSTEGVALAGWGRSGEGGVDPNALMSLFRSAARDRGVAYVADEVVAIARDGNRVTGVTLESGTTIACGAIVNAAGWHSGKIARMVGLTLPVEPRKRQIFVFDCKTPLPGCGLMIDPGGAFFRPEGRYYVAGISPPEDRDPSTESFEIDHTEFDHVVWPALAARVPALETIKIVNAWACHYDYNTLDQNAILGPHTEVSNFYFASGFSGHGLQQSPAVGRAIAEHVMHGGYRSIALDRFGYARVAARSPLKELNVI
jgi:glycine/D-amino acid oxidase-like deaminating enzyme